MIAKKFQRRCEQQATSLRELINIEMPYKGDTEETSQKLVLLNRISAFEQAVNGVVNEDMS